MSEFKNYIDSIMNDIMVDSDIRKDIIDEIEDHLKLSKMEYINKGYSEEEATENAKKSFGEVRRIKNKYAITFNPFSKITRICAAFLFLLYISLIIKLSFFSIFSYISLSAHKYNTINLVPLKSISHYLFNFHSFNYDTWFNNVFGMIIALIPFGFLVPIMRNRIKGIHFVIIPSILFSVTIEIFQHITERGVADVDDIILGTIGSALGYILLKLVVNFMLKFKRQILSSTKTKNTNSYSD